jgi:hypothetical protein
MNKHCADTGCNEKHYARGYCKHHYRIHRKSGLLGILPPRPIVLCSVDGCNDPFSAKGFCQKHYREFKIRNNPTVYKDIETKRKQRAKEFKKSIFIERGSKCEICGYGKNIHCIDFHHIDPAKKDLEPTKAFRKNNIEEIRKEIDKCQMLCKNCHNDIHHPDGRL